VRNRRNDSRHAAERAVGAVVTLGFRLWRKAADRPVDSLAIVGAGAVSLVIIVNAVFLQTGPHPTPFFAMPTSPPRAVDSRPSVLGVATPKPAEAVPARPAAGLRTPQIVSARRNDPIADLIGSPSRVMAVQRVLSEFGYGQIRPSGILDEPTSAAIEKFEREHKLPVTGRLSDRLLAGLAAMAGRPLD
jgi:hypothetical protein